MSQAIAVCHGEFGRAALYRLDRTIIKHAHREGHLIFHIDETISYLEVGDTPHLMDEDHCIAVSPWEPHSFIAPPKGANLSLVLYIKPMWFLENGDSAEFALKFGAVRLQITNQIRDDVNRLTALLLESEEDARFGPLLFGLTKACFDLSWEKTGDECRNQACRRFSDFRVRRALRLIQNGLPEDMEMEQLARSVGLSRPHFFKLFKQYMGVTPNVYLNTLRSERAIEDLIATDKTVTDIAFDLGFSSQASFTRFFSSNVGIAPSEYRRVAHISSGAFPMMGKPIRLSGMPPAARPA